MARGDTERAARLLGAAERIREVGAAPMVMNERSTFEAAVAAIRQQLSAAALGAAWNEGRGLTTEEAVALANPTDGDA